MNINPQVYYIILIIIFKLSLLLGLCWLVYFLLIYKKSISRDKSWYLYKINNFILNRIFIAIYVCMFIIFFTYLRIKRISLFLDLNVVILKFTNINMHLLNRVFLLFLYALIILIFIIIINKINKFFIKEIKKLHLYFSYITVKDGKATYSFYHDFYDHYKRSEYSYIMVRSTITGYIIRLIFLFNKSIDCIYFIDKVHIILISIPILLIPILFLYDCYFNNFVIIKVFYYLIFYMFYSIWYKVSTFLWYEEHSYGSILYEVYYSTDKISYCNVPEELENILLNYMKKGLYNVHPFMIDMNHNEITPDEYASEIKKYRHFSVDGKEYKNPLTGEYYMIDNPTLFIPKNITIYNMIEDAIIRFKLYIHKIKTMLRNKTNK